MAKRETESDILRSVCEYLWYRRHFFWRANNTSVFMPDRGAYRAMPVYAKAGVPDIILVEDGKFIGIEVKTKIGQQSTNQEEFQQGLEAAGGRYIIVRSIDDVKEAGL